MEISQRFALVFILTTYLEWRAVGEDPVGDAFRKFKKETGLMGMARLVRYVRIPVAISNGSSSHPFAVRPLVVAVEREAEVFRSLVGTRV